ncbi:MAG: CHAD domain-containing protein [Hydrogenimonas sp.]|nr:CHAD domain-containing protein [Hydrogenimonas sp.]
MKHFEIERRFLLYPCSVKRFLKSCGIEFDSVDIEQFYLKAQEEEVLRYRRRGDRYFITLKSGSGLVRSESEKEVSKKEYEAALKRNRGGVVRKRRYLFYSGGLLFELDSFKKPLKGLNILEVEFKSEKEAKEFELPKIFKRILVDEVTGNPTFSNGYISKKMKIPALKTPLSELLKDLAERKDFSKASVDLSFKPFESSLHASQSIICSLLETVRYNKDEIVSHTQDQERLHQLRVALRKIRALFSVCKELFEPTWLNYHRQRVKELMRKSGSLRDIDVYLSQIDEYKELLPKKRHEALKSLESYLLSRQKIERKRLEEFLLSEEFQKEMQKLEHFAKRENPEGAGEKGEDPVIIPLKRAMMKYYRKIVGNGAKIDASSPAHDYHMLRIEVKKLRYLMEFFHPVFDREAYVQMLGRLKSIQSILGAHQDLDVQREHLREFFSLKELHDENTIEALKILREELKRLQELKRSEFRKEFKEFLKTKKLFKRVICKF